MATQGNFMYSEQDRDLARRSALAVPRVLATLYIETLRAVPLVSVLFMAALHALLLSVQSRGLKHRSPSSSRSLLKVLPPLQTMETVLFDFISAGFGLLSLAIISGFLTLDNMFAQHLVHKTILTLLAWCIFGVLLIGHYWRGWRGQRAVRFTLAGFGILLLGFYGSKLVLELILHRH